MKLTSALKGTFASAALCLGLAATAAPAQAAHELRCDSAPGGYNYCRTDTSSGVTLNVQHSRYGCYQNDTWGFDRNGVWVSNGCSATFVVGPRKNDDGKTAAAVGLGILALGIIAAVASKDDQNDYPPSQPGYDPNYPPPQDQDQYQNQYDDYDPYEDAQIVYCDSKKYKLRICPVRVSSHVELVRQKSKNACRFNKTWGYDRRGIWVNKGCRAEFAVF